MDNSNQTASSPNAGGNSEVNISRLNRIASQDLQDSPQDEEKMKPK
jgi:hypothetical protein